MDAFRLMEIKAAPSERIAELTVAIESNKGFFRVYVPGGMLRVPVDLHQYEEVPHFDTNDLETAMNLAEIAVMEHIDSCLETKQ